MSRNFRCVFKVNGSKYTCMREPVVEQDDHDQDIPDINEQDGTRKSRETEGGVGAVIGDLDGRRGQPQPHQQAFLIDLVNQVENSAGGVLAMMNQGQAQEANQSQKRSISTASISSGVDIQGLVRTAVDQFMVTILPEYEESANAKCKERIKQLECQVRQRDERLEMMTLENRKLKVELLEVKEVLKGISEQGAPLKEGVAQAKSIISSALTTIGAQFLAVEAAIQNAYAIHESGMSGCPLPATVAAAGIVEPPDVVPVNQVVDLDVTSQDERQRETLPVSRPPFDDNSNQAQPFAVFKEETDEQVNLEQKLPPASVSSGNQLVLTPPQSQPLSRNGGECEGSSTAKGPQENLQPGILRHSANRSMNRRGLRTSPKGRVRFADVSEPARKRHRTRTRSDPSYEVRRRHTEDVKRQNSEAGIFCDCGLVFPTKAKLQKHLKWINKD